MVWRLRMWLVTCRPRPWPRRRGWWGRAPGPTAAPPHTTNQAITHVVRARARHNTTAFPADCSRNPTQHYRALKGACWVRTDVAFHAWHVSSDGGDGRCPLPPPHRGSGPRSAAAWSPCPSPPRTPRSTPCPPDSHSNRRPREEGRREEVLVTTHSLPSTTSIWCLLL